ERVQRDLRLIHEQQLAGLDRAPQRLLEAKRARRGIREIGTEDCETVAPEVLGAKQSNVGGTQERIGIRRMVRIQARPDTGARREDASIDGDRLLQGIEQL